MHDYESDRIHVSSTSVVYPTGDGASDASLANSIFSTSRAGRAVLTGVLVTANAAGGTLTFYKIDGTTVAQTVVVASGFFGFIPLPNVSWKPLTSGAITNGGFGVKTSVGTLIATAFFYTRPG